jgi:hypothetical protein
MLERRPTWQTPEEKARKVIHDLLGASVALPKKVKQSMTCHPERSEGSLQLFWSVNCCDASLRSA